MPLDLRDLAARECDPGGRDHGLSRRERRQAHDRVRCARSGPGVDPCVLRDRDSAFNDDFVGVVLDTFNDERRAFEFFVNPFGVQMDLIQDDVNRNESESWDAIWDSAGVITRAGFTVEMAIPFSQLRFPRARPATQTWGIDMLRFWPRDQRVRISNNRARPQPQLLPMSVRQVHGLRQRGARQGARDRADADGDAHGFARPTGGVAGQPLEPGDLETEAGPRRALGNHAGPDARPHAEPRLLAGRGRRRAARGEHAVRAVLPGVTAVLPRRRGLLLEPAASRVHAHRRRPRRRREVHGPDGQQHDRRVRDERRGHEPVVPRAVRLADDFA